MTAVSDATVAVTGLADLAMLSERSKAFESAQPGEIVRWAADTYGDGLVFTSSFEDAVLLDVIAKAAPHTRVVLLDTQYHFAETLWYVEQLTARYSLNLEVVSPLAHVVPDNLWQSDVEACCDVRKVEPLRRALQDKAAWITGVRRVDGPTRATTPIVSWDIGRSITKINPLATWSDEDMATYALIHQLPAHPLSDKGYASIGCWPCTRPVAPGEDRRAGRWSGNAKTECGLHK
jgi:phosphoadenosine phosphosulfate reductase